MKEAKARTYSLITQQAVLLLGKEVKAARKERRMSEAELAERAGISRLTLRKIEKGDLRIGIGLFFEAAAIVGVKLFDPGPSRFSMAGSLARLDDKIALLPRRIRTARKTEVDDDF